MLVRTPGTGQRIDSSKVFDSESLARVKAGKSVNAIQCDGKSQLAQLVSGADSSKSLIHKAFRRFVSLVRGEANIGKGLFSAYIRKFRNLTANTVSHTDEISPRVSPSTLQKVSRTAELQTPEGFQVAAAMELAGVCKLNHGRFGGVKIKSTRKDLNEKDLRRVDYFVNLNPHRLAFEFLALNRTVPNGYLERVLIPHYCDRLVEEAGFSPGQASSAVSALTSLKELTSDGNVDLEQLMEMRVGLDQLIASHGREVSSVEHVSPRIPKGKQLAGSLSGIVKITTSQVLEHGQASRQAVREYFINELRKQGTPREKARETVVAVLSQRGCAALESQLSVTAFLNIARALKLNQSHSQSDMIRVYLRLVDHLNAAVRCVTPNQRCRIMERAGLSEDDVYTAVHGCEGKVLKVIERPVLEPPAISVGYNCNEDELWLIQARVDRSHTLRITRDIINRIIRFTARSKRVIAVELAARLSAAVTLGLMTGGWAGAMYVVTSCLSITCLIASNFALSHIQYWWHGRKIVNYDKAGKTTDPKERSDMMGSLSHLVSERALTDVFNAYANMKDSLAGLEDIRNKANLSAGDQIKLRRYQVLQQLRSAQLGESLKDMERLVVETVTEISDMEDTFEKGFDQLWKPFGLNLTDEKTDPVPEKSLDSCDQESLLSHQEMTKARRLKIFRKAAKQLKELPLKAREDSQNWLREMVLSEETVKGKEGEKIWLKESARVLNEAFSELKPLPPKELRISAMKAKLNWIGCNSLDAAAHTGKVIAHFLWNSLSCNASNFAKAAFKWVVFDVAPRKKDLTPIPTFVACVYWVVAFVGGRFSEMVNNARNRVRASKIIKSRKDEEGRDLAFDAEVTRLTAEDWRAMRGESKQGVDGFVKVLKELRKEHADLLKELQNIRSEDKPESDEKALVKRARLILRRKLLEQQLQDYLHGSVGHFFQETIRGELNQRQLLSDIDRGIIPVHG